MAPPTWAKTVVIADPQGLKAQRSNLQTTCEFSGDCFASLAKTAKVLPGFVTAQRGEVLAMTGLSKWHSPLSPYFSLNGNIRGNPSLLDKD
jgi:hypothetical protein